MTFVVNVRASVFRTLPVSAGGHDQLLSKQSLSPLHPADPRSLRQPNVCHSWPVGQKQLSDQLHFLWVAGTRSLEPCHLHLIQIRSRLETSQLDFEHGRNGRPSQRADLIQLISPSCYMPKKGRPLLDRHALKSGLKCSVNHPRNGALEVIDRMGCCREFCDD